MALSHLQHQTGMDQTRIDPYSYTEMAWNNPNYPEYHKWHYLSTKCVSYDAGFYVKCNATDRWVYRLLKTAINELVNRYGGVQVHQGVQISITRQDVEHFVHKMAVTVDGTMFAPGCSDQVIYDGTKRLNIYRNGRMIGDTRFIPNAEPFLQIIRNSLCAEPDVLGLDEMLEEIKSDRPTAFRWAMHWLAARYQYPGLTTQTNLWFIGPTRGVGKGSLVKAMTQALGGDTVGKINREELQRGWNTQLLGKELIEWDEFKSEKGWRDFNNIIKEYTGNTEVSIMMRNKTPMKVPTISMHLFTTNDERPILVEKHDRQNTMIATTNDEYWCQRAKALYDPYTNTFADPNLVSGFCAFLNSFEVDMAFIRKMFMTQTFLELLEYSSDNLTDWWKESGHPEEWQQVLTKKGSPAVKEWSDVYGAYRNWVQTNANSKPLPFKIFKKESQKRGFITDTVTTLNGVNGRFAKVSNVITPLIPQWGTGSQMDD